jgi:hypothetical protein
MSKRRIISKRLIEMWRNKFTLDPALAKKKTQKGAKHIIGTVFKSYSPFDITPAQYRHYHYKVVDGKLLKPEKERKKK